MKAEELYEKWQKYCKYGDGKDTRRVGSHWYRGDFYYFQDRCKVRFVEGVFLMDTTVNCNLPEQPWWGHLALGDIGVFSDIEGDWLEGSELHARMQWVFVKRIQHYVDVDIPEFSGEQLVKRWSTWDRSTNPPRQNPSKRQLEHNLDKLDRLIANYNDYREALYCLWSDIPAGFKLRAAETMVAAVNKYLDPDAVKRREKAAARKLAEKALGVNQTVKKKSSRR